VLYVHRGREPILICGKNIFGVIFFVMRLNDGFIVEDFRKMQDAWLIPVLKDCEQVATGLRQSWRKQFFRRRFVATTYITY